MEKHLLDTILLYENLGGPYHHLGQSKQFVTHPCIYSIYSEGFLHKRPVRLFNNIKKIENLSDMHNLHEKSYKWEVSSFTVGTQVNNKVLSRYMVDIRQSNLVVLD